MLSQFRRRKEGEEFELLETNDVLVGLNDADADADDDDADDDDVNDDDYRRELCMLA